MKNHSLKAKRKYFTIVSLFSAVFLSILSTTSISRQVSQNIISSKNIKTGELIFQYRFQSLAVQTLLQKKNEIQQNIQLQQIQNLIGVTDLKPLIPPDLLKGLEAVSPVDEFFILNYDENLSFGYVKDLLKSVSRIIKVEPVKKYRLALDFFPNDPEFAKQYHLPQISAPAAWDSTQGDSAVIIAIVDNGFDLTHPDLQANYWQNVEEVNGQAGIDDDGNGFIDDKNGYDFAEDDTDPSFVFSNLKENSHGTHIAGIAGAIGNNQIGGAGVSWKSKILPIKVFKDDDPLFTDATYFLPGIVYAIKHGSKIINLSWGNLGEPVDIEQGVMNLAYRNGVIVVGAAGNNNSKETHFPSGYHHVVSVGAVDAQEQKINFSNYGNSVDIMAPGDGIFSTFVENKYGFISGTSMATPIVAGVAALVWSQNKTLTIEQVIQNVVCSADQINAQNPEYIDQLGNGRVNVFRAITTNDLKEPKAKLELNQFVVNDSLHGNNNQLIEKGETIALFISLTNLSLGDEPSLFVNISTPNDSEIQWQTKLQTVFAVADSDFTILDPFVCTIPENFSKSFVQFIVEFFGANVVTQKDTLIYQVGKYPILIVDDDGSKNIEGYYTLPLKSLSVPYAVWDHHRFSTPDISDLNDFSSVVWFCEGSFPSLDLQDQNVITDYLSGGGNLFLSGQDIGFDLVDPVSLNSDETSRIFYQNSLRATYFDNNAEENRVLGVPGDVIGNNMDFFIFQPGLADNQSPDIIEPLDSANSIFYYDNYKGVGGIRFDRNYRLVYLGFGLEAINSGISVRPAQIDPIRSQVYYRILNYLHPLRHKQINDQITTNTAIKISAEYLGTGDPPENVTLHYKLPQDSNFNFLNLQGTENTFSVEMPINNQYGEVLYYFEIQNLNYSWYLPIDGIIHPYSFRIGSDNKPPDIFYIESVNQFSLQSEYSILASIKDNTALDSSSLYLIFKSNRSEIDTSLMFYQPIFDQFEGKIVNDFMFGDTISYWISVSDRANPPNSSQSKTSQFVIGLEKFEMGRLNWDVSLNGWGLDSSDVYSGNFAINSSPYETYSNNLDVSIFSRDSFDLSKSSSIELQFYSKYIIESGDEGTVEIKIDNQDWQKTAGPFSGFQGNWALTRVNLSPFAGNQNCMLRFRFVSNEKQTTPLKGWTIDDIRIVQDQYITSVNFENENNIPVLFHLSQGFPNPFHDKVQFEFEIPQHADISVFIYNVLGKKVKDLSLKSMKKNHKIYWDGTDCFGENLPSGIYFVKAIFQNQNLVKKIILIH